MKHSNNNNNNVLQILVYCLNFGLCLIKVRVSRGPIQYGGRQCKNTKKKGNNKNKETGEMKSERACQSLNIF